MFLVVAQIKVYKVSLCNEHAATLMEGHLKLGKKVKI